MSENQENPNRKPEQEGVKTSNKVAGGAIVLLLLAVAGFLLCHPSLRGQSLQEKGDYAQALEIYGESIKNPLYVNDPSIYLARAYCYSQLGDVEKSEAEVKKAEEVHAGLPFYWSTGDLVSNRSVKFRIAFRKAMNYFDRQDNENALIWLNKALEEGEDGPAYIARGKVHEALGDLKSAESDFKEANQVTLSRYVKATEGACHELGSFYARHSRLSEALPYFDRAIRAWSCPSAIRERGLVHWKLGEHDKALEDFNKSLELKESASAYSNRAMFYRERGEYAAALKDIDSAIALASDRAKPRYEKMKETIGKELNDPALNSDSGF